MALTITDKCNTFSRPVSIFGEARKRSIAAARDVGAKPQSTPQEINSAAAKRLDWRTPVAAGVESALNSHYHAASILE
jgi:hypothetical protein